MAIKRHVIRTAILHRQSILGNAYRFRRPLAILVSDEEFVLFEDNGPATFDAQRVSTALKSDHVVIDLNLGSGEQATIYTCDFGYGYVRINAEYHT